MGVKVVPVRSNRASRRVNKNAQRGPSAENEKPAANTNHVGDRFVIFGWTRLQIISQESKSPCPTLGSKAKRNCRSDKKNAFRRAGAFEDNHHLLRKEEYGQEKSERSDYRAT